MFCDRDVVIVRTPLELNGLADMFPTGCEVKLLSLLAGQSPTSLTSLQ